MFGSLCRLPGSKQELAMHTFPRRSFAEFVTEVLQISDREYNTVLRKVELQIVAQPGDEALRTTEKGANICKLSQA
jgi:hypothetical protein